MKLEKKSKVKKVKLNRFIDINNEGAQQWLPHAALLAPFIFLKLSPGDDLRQSLTELSQPSNPRWLDL